MTELVRSPRGGVVLPGVARRLRRLVGALFADAAGPSRVRGASGSAARRPRAPRRPAYSGVPAAASWASVRSRSMEPGEPGPGDQALVVVLLGPTTGPAGSMASLPGPRRRLGRAVRGSSTWTARSPPTSWRSGPRSTSTATRIIGEHSIEVQLPLLAAAAPGTRIVHAAVSAGTGRRAIEAGARSAACSRRVAPPATGSSSRSAPGACAHYPPGRHLRAGDAVTPAGARGRPGPGRLATLEEGMRGAGIHRTCLRHVRDRSRRARPRGAAGYGRHDRHHARRIRVGPTPADRRDRTVGYLAARFDA